MGRNGQKLAAKPAKSAMHRNLDIGSDFSQIIVNLLGALERTIP